MFNEEKAGIQLQEERFIMYKTKGGKYKISVQLYSGWREAYARLE